MSQPSMKPVGKSGPAVNMATLIVKIAPAGIAAFKAAIESYDNLATLRTEDPSSSRLRLWFDERVRNDVMEVIESLSGSLSIRILNKQNK